MEMPPLRTLALILGLTVGGSGCSAPDAERPAGEAPPDAERPAGEVLPDAAGGATVHEYAHLEDEVDHLLEFLGGDAPLRHGLLADSVTLYIAPEGGGETRTMAAAALRSPSAWRVASHRFAPPDGYGHRIMTPGLHWNCQPAELATLYPDLAARAHVGVRLAPDESAGCLQTWNATFVFDSNAQAPRLTAVVYDQWEW